MSSLGEVTIRVAGPGDAPDIARVHVASWRSGYAGIIPDEYLAALDPTAGQADWAARLVRDSGHVWVALAEDRTVGFASLGPCRDEDCEPGDLELYTMYLEPDAWGRGVARELMRTILAEVDSAPVSLWVPADATRAQHFYRRHGFLPDGVERRDEIGGTDLTVARLRRTPT